MRRKAERIEFRKMTKEEEAQHFYNMSFDKLCIVLGKEAALAKVEMYRGKDYAETACVKFGLLLETAPKSEAK